MFFVREPILFPQKLNEIFCDAMWGGEPSELELQKNGKALSSLWGDLALHRGFHKGGQHYSFRKDQVEAYTAYYLLSNALKPAMIAEEALLLNNDIFSHNEAHWLDIGTGPGTAYWGLSWWCQQRGKKLQFTGWDQSSGFIQKATEISNKNPFGSKAHFHQAKKGDKEWLRFIEEKKPTHVSFVNSIAEIFPDTERRLSAIKELLLCLKKMGGERFLLIIEPGSRESSRELSLLKDSLTKEYSVHLPCLDTRPCGALTLAQDWCHEEVPCEFPLWMNKLGAQSGMKKESMLFSYCLLSTALPGPLGKRARVVSQRLERKGQVECHLCLPDKKQKVRVQRSKATEENRFLLTACKGDIFQSISYAEKGDIIAADPMKKNHLTEIFYRP